MPVGGATERHTGRAPTPPGWIGENELKRSVGEVWKLGRAAAWAQLGLRRATEVAYTVTLQGRPHVRNQGTITIGDRSMLLSTVSPIELVAYEDASIEIGEQAFINYGCSISASGEVRIGADCNIGTHVIIMDNEFHSIEPERRNEIPESRPIELADNVWIGGRSIVLGGVSIGYGSVIGAGSVVTKDVPDRSIAVGVPARVIREI